MGFLIDTGIWVDVERGHIAPADVEVYTAQEAVFISPVTIAELTFGMEMAHNDAIRHKRLAALSRLRKKPLLAIDEVTGDIFGCVAAALFKKGKQSSHRVQDIWLASQAIQYDYQFLTKNAKNFADIPGIKMVVYGAM